MTAMGVDPHASRPYSYAVVVDGKLMQYGDADICGIAEAIEMCHPDLVAVEDQYLFKNYDAAKKLSWAAGKVIGVCELYSLQCAVVNVASWKARFKVTNLHGKALAEAALAEVLGGQPKPDHFSEDQGCASLIALFAHEWMDRMHSEVEDTKLILMRSMKGF